MIQGTFTGTLNLFCGNVDSKKHRLYPQVHYLFIVLFIFLTLCKASNTTFNIYIKYLTRSDKMKVNIKFYFVLNYKIFKTILPSLFGKLVSSFILYEFWNIWDDWFFLQNDTE